MSFDPKTTAKEFFENMVPQIATSHKDKLTPEQKAVNHAVAFVLTGTGGGEWTIGFANGDVSVKPGIQAGANPVVHLSAEHWHDVMTGKRVTMGAVGNFTDMDMSHFKPILLQRLKPIKGTLKIVVEDEAEGDMDTTVQFGEGAPANPTTTMRMKADIARQVQEKKLNPQQAFMQGHIKIQGDMNLVMQVATLIMP